MPNPTGHRDSIKNSQFKAAWHSGPTRTIRVPIALAEVTLEYARQLDRGVEPRDTAQKPDNKTSVDRVESRDTAIIVSSEPFTLTGSEGETLDTMLKSEVKTARAEIEIDRANIAQQPDTELYPFIETVLTEVESVKLELEAVRAENQLLQIETTNLQAEREELAQLKKEVKEDAAELHREENSMKLEKVRWQRELSDAKSELKDAQATLVKQSNKIRELERGYSFKPNPKESALIREIGELREQLETERAAREENKKSAPVEKDLPEAADLLNKLKAKRKKSKTDLADLEAILELLEG